MIKKKCKRQWKYTVVSSCIICKKHERMLSSFSCVRLYDPMDCSLSGSSLSMGILPARTVEWLSCPPPGDVPDLGIEPRSPTLAGRFFKTSATWEASYVKRYNIIHIYQYYIFLYVYKCIHIYFYIRE